MDDELAAKNAAIDAKQAQMTDDDNAELFTRNPKEWDEYRNACLRVLEL